MGLGTVPGEKVSGLSGSTNVMSLDRRTLFVQEVVSFMQKHNVPADQQATIRNQFEQEFQYLHVCEGQLCYKFIEDSKVSFYPFGIQCYYSEQKNGDTTQYGLMLYKVQSPLSWGPPVYLHDVRPNRLPYESTTVNAITTSVKSHALNAIA